MCAFKEALADGHVKVVIINRMKKLTEEELASEICSKENE